MEHFVQWIKVYATYNLKTMNDLISTSAAPRRVPMLLLSAFAGVAMLLAMLGIYGITSYYVTQRTHEIGVRMALGAQIADVLKLVLRRAMLLAVIGVVIGLAGAAAVTRYLTSLLFGVQTHRCLHVCRGRVGVSGGGVSGFIDPRETGDESGSAGGAQIRVEQLWLCKSP